MSTQAAVLIDSSATFTPTATMVIPVLQGAVTGTGSAVAAQITGDALRDFFQGGTSDFFTSTVAVATPSALAATQFTGFASTVSGATLMGFGTTGDVTLKNRAGTDVLVVTSNTLNVTMAGALAITGALSGVTALTYSTLLSSVTALATPSALAATALNAFASTVSGGVLMGFGTTHDVALKNRAGTTVLGVGPNTTAITMAGSASVVGAFGCNGATAQASAVVGAALASYGTGVFGLDSDANMQALYDLVVAMRAALVANGIAVAS